MKRTIMSAHEFKTAIAKLDLTQGQAAAFFGVSLRSVHAYANGARINPFVAMLLRVMIKMKLKPEDVI